MCRRPTIAALPTAGHTGPALQALYQLRTPCQNPVIANRCAHRCGNPYSSRMVRCRKGNTDSHVASLLGMTFYENTVSIGGGAEPPPLRMFCKFLCRAAPMCAAARQSPHFQRRGTLAPPYRRFTNFVPHAKTLSLRTGAHTGVAIRIPPAWYAAVRGIRIPTSLRSSE